MRSDGVEWVAAGLGNCNHLTSTHRGTVVAACDQGAFEVHATGTVTRLHDTTVEHVAFDDDVLWVKLPDTLLWGPLPAVGAPFVPTKKIALGTVEDIHASGRALLVATPKSVISVNPDTAILSRRYKVEMPLRGIAWGATRTHPKPHLSLLAHDSIWAVVDKELVPVVQGLDDARCILATPDGRLLVSTGKQRTVGVVRDGSWMPLDIDLHGLTDLTLHDPGTGLELWFTSSDGSIGHAPLR